VVLIVQGWLATQYEHKASLYGFIVCQCLIGMSLGAAKAMIGNICFKVYSAINFVDSFSVMLGVFGTAALIGPILGWLSLSNHGFPGDPNYTHDLGHSVAYFCWGSAGSMALSCAISFAIKKIDWSKYQHLREEEEAEEGLEAGQDAEKPVSETSDEGQPLMRPSIETVVSMASMAGYIGDFRSSATL
jgi:hypothetical protein